MSMICENTYVVKNNKLKDFLNHLLSRRDEMRINGIKTVYSNSEYTLLVFDSNGDPHYYPDFTNDYVIGETSFEHWPDTYTKCYDCLQTPIAKLIKDKILFPKIGDKKRAEIINAIEYTV